MPPPEPRCYERLIKQAADKLDITCVPSRMSIITQPHNGRPACHYCGQCNRGCSTHSNFSSPSVLIPPALATKRLTIHDRRDGARSDDRRRWPGDRRHLHRQENRARESRPRPGRRARGQRLRVGAHPAQFASTHFPQGVGNSTGNVGKYLTDSTGVGVTGFIPKMMEMPPHNEDGVGGMHLYMPWWLDNKKLPFPRGYHIEIGGGRRMPSFGFMGNIHLLRRRPGFGHAAGRHRLRQDAQGRLSPLLRLHRGVRRARRDDPEREELLRDSIRRVVDKFGHPGAALPLPLDRLRVLQAKHMQEPSARSSTTMGGSRWRRCRAPTPTTASMAGGRIIHEIGVTRMGNDPKTLGRQRQLPGARRQEPVCRRRRSVRLAAGQESDVDDPRAGLAHERLHPGAAERRSHLMPAINRRQVLQLLGAAPIAAGFVWTEAEVAQAQQRTQQARRAPRGRSSRRSSPRTSSRPSRCSPS